jgi:alpha-glucoside transport system substrate-binding protein
VTPGRARANAVLGIATSLGLLLTACGAGTPATDVAEPAPRPECSAYAQYGDLSGRTITVAAATPAPTPTPTPTATPTSPASPSASAAGNGPYAAFTGCTGATVRTEQSPDLPTTLPARIGAGNPPDLAILPRPGLLAVLVHDTKAVKPAPAAVSTNVDTYFPQTDKSAGSVDGTLYAAPLSADLRSLVWYSPKVFAAKGYTVPTTWDEMIALSDRIVAAGGTPWCAGTGPATGGALTDWVEDVVLRVAGPEVYDQWVTRRIPFTDPRVVAALDKAATILKNPTYLNGGLGGLPSVAATPAEDAGRPVLDGTCFLHHQAASYAAAWPAGTEIGEHGDVYAFVLPPVDTARPAVLVGGQFVAAFSDRPEVQAFQAYLSSPQWANEPAGATPDGGGISANSGLDTGHLTRPIDTLSAQILQDPDTTVRFDASDLLPAPVGTTMESALAGWITGPSSAEVLAAVAQAWPA